PERPGSSRKVVRERVSRDVCRAGGIDGNALGGIQAGAAQVGGVGERARRRELGDERIPIPARGGLEGAEGREIVAQGRARYVRCARGIQRNAERLVVAPASEVGGVN